MGEVNRRTTPATRRRYYSVGTAMTEAIQIYIVEGDLPASASLEGMLKARGFQVKTFHSSEEWLRYKPEDKPSCAIIDYDLGDRTTGLEVLRRMAAEGSKVPSIMVSSYGDIRTALTAVELGAADFLEKPVKSDELIQSIGTAVQKQSHELVLRAEVIETERRYVTLSEREQTILKMVCQGVANKVIANRLELGLRTVESCRAQLLKSFEAKTWPELIAKVARLEAYRARQPKIMPPKFLSRREYGRPGELDAPIENTLDQSHF